MSFAQLTVLRHGQSTWNQENRFAGWVDVPLSEGGKQEAAAAAIALSATGMSFDVSFSSYLRRAIGTLWIILETMDLMWLPQHLDWRLNERHYGALQGQNKAETIARYGEDQVKLWRRSYATPPPPLTTAVSDNRYAGVEAPVGESLQDVMPRLQSIWRDSIAPLLRQQKRVLIVAHGNSLRALIKELECMSDEEIIMQEIPTAVPLVYHLDKELRPISRQFLDR